RTPRRPGRRAPGCGRGRHGRGPRPPRAGSRGRRPRYAACRRASCLPQDCFSPALGLPARLGAALAVDALEAEALAVDLADALAAADFADDAFAVDALAVVRAGRLAPDLPHGPLTQSPRLGRRLTSLKISASSR